MSKKLLDGFARGELSPAESRDLAQQSLGDQDLFDNLTATAIARRGLATRGKRFITWPRIAIFTAAAAAIILDVVLRTAPGNSESRPGASTSAPPTLLARSRDSNPSAFRGVDTGDRESRATGSIGSVANGVAAISLGSIDGLEKGAELDVIRGGQAIGRIKLTTIFRDHSRGEIVSGSSIAVNDQIRVPPSERMRTILDRIDATLARGEAGKAMSIAQQASPDGLDAGLSSEEDLNNAGVIAELHGDPTKAGELYRRALEKNPSGRDRETIERNIARLKGAK